MWAYTWVIRSMAVCAAVILVGMSLWITYDVIARYVFVRPTIWAGDLSEYGLLWATFLAAPWVLHEEGHVRVEILVDRLSARRRNALGVAVSVIAALTCIVFAWQTGLTTFDLFDRGLMEARIWRVPQWAVYVVIPLGSALLAVEFIFRAIRQKRGGVEEASAAHRAEGSF